MKEIKLSEISTHAPASLNKELVKEETRQLLQRLDELQNLLYAEKKHSLLVIIQGMDASGKDGAVRHVFSAANPQGVRVQSFKVPTAEEADHDFLWRIHRVTPEKGMIQVFNRSHYEDVLVTSVHRLIDADAIHQRFRAINDFEWLLTHVNHTTVLKFYLHISKAEQTKRLQERLNDKTKQWKYNEQDITEARLFKKYLKAYEACFKHCNNVPWQIIPADQNWYKEFLIASAVCKKLEHLNMRYPGLKK